MGSIEMDETQANGISEETPSSVMKLHNIVHQLETENDLPPTKSEKCLIDSDRNNISKDLASSDPYSLENTTDITEFDCDTDLDSEDSWLYESPKKLSTPGKESNSPDKWLKNNTTTPELMRVRGSLAAKLDVIAIESRKGMMSNNSIDSQHTKDRGESMMTVNSLDWDYDDVKGSRLKKRKNVLENINVNGPNDTVKQDLDNTRQAWSEPAGRVEPSDSRSFSLNWSDDEEELVPMKIDFNASPQSRSSGLKANVANGAVRRSAGSNINTLATPRQGENYDYDDLLAKPQGGVKPRGAGQPVARLPVDNDNDFDDDAPVVPRGAVKPRAAKAKKKTSFAENILIHPIIKEEAFNSPPPTRLRQTPQKQTIDKRQSPAPRSVGVAKPAQRKSAGETSVRPRTVASTSNLIRPRSSAQTMNKSSSASDILDSSLKAQLPSGGDGAVVRRRGAPGPSASSGLPAPRKSKESPQVARTQGIPQVRKSTGSLPQKSGEGMVRPRQSPSNAVRPRGSGMTTQSYQADY